VEIEKKLQSLELGLTDTLILDLLSNTAYSYMGTDDDGLSTSAVTDRGKEQRKGQEGDMDKGKDQDKERTRTGTWNSQSFFKDPYGTIAPKAPYG
jgi:hypothetical protein